MPSKRQVSRCKLHSQKADGLSVCDASITRWIFYLAAPVMYYSAAGADPVVLVCDTSWGA